MTLAAVTIQTISIISGPVVGLAYFVGTIPWRLMYRRGQLDNGTITADDAASDRRAEGREGEHPAVIAEAAVPLVFAIVVMMGIEQIAPMLRSGFEPSSAIGGLYHGVLPVWDSIALWTGAAAVLGQVAPIWTRFRGGTGMPAAMSLGLFFAPWIFVAVIAGYLAAFWFLRNRQPALVIGFVAGLTYAWLGWVWDFNPAWGVNFGPELALWTAVLMAMLAPRILLADEYLDTTDPMGS